MVSGLTLVCPVRGRLKVTGRSSDGLTPNEERFRVEAIKHLVDRGYPKENFVIEPVIKRFGNGGRNSFRADFAVLDVPAAGMPKDVDTLLDRAILLAEVKRSNSSAQDAKEFQVKPLLAFSGKTSCVAVYWDNVEQRVFWQTQTPDGRVTHEGPIANLPDFGQKPGVVALTLKNLRTDGVLRQIFDRIEDVLHSASIGPSKRFTVMLQLLLAKLHDEHQHVVTDDGRLTIQDYRSLGMNVPAARASFDELLTQAAQYYERHLPEPVPSTLTMPDETFLEVMALLAPHRITAMKHSVIQDFYMYFAKGLYKWDLAQYFTPPSLTDFIVDFINPQWNEQVRDPACGSADFLTAAFRRGQEYPDYASRIWGSDVSSEAAQVAVLNMVLNGDGKSNIKVEDSLVTMPKNAGKWDVVVCNPPFGVRILERNVSTLKKYDLGHRMDRENGEVEWKVTSDPLPAQETGILFAELCVRLARPGTGRVALVVPNGYLGNRSGKYHQLRSWLMLNAKVAAVVALPRFTFKSSGADVSASVIFLEKRAKPLRRLADIDSYDVAVQVINRVGWTTGDKKAAPTFKRDVADGTFLLDEDSEMILDSDFGPVLHWLRSSDAAQDFEWFNKNLQSKPITEDHDDNAWSVSSDTILADPFLTLDPKRLNKKFTEVVNDIKAVDHFRLGDVFDVVPELQYADGSKLKLKAEQDYRYVELQNVEAGTYRSESMKGWELPARAKHIAERGDFFIAGLWSSVRKWFLMGETEETTLVTNGMHRLRLKPEAEGRRLDLVAGFCSEAFRVQMRGMARGSDGLAEVNADDILEIVIPVVKDAQVRDELWPFVNQLLKGFTTVEAKVEALLADKRLELPDVPRRQSHVMVV